MEIIKYFEKSIRTYFGKEKDSIKYIDKKTNYKEVFLFIVIIGIISNILLELISPQYKTEYLIYQIIGFILIIPVSILISTGITHLFLKLFGGKAEFKDTLKFSNSISIFPLIIITILSLISIIIKSSIQNIQIITDIIIPIIIFSIIIWSLIINAKVFSKIHKISFLRSILSLILPIVVLMILAMIIMIFLFTKIF